ncbi:CsbD family protein [Sphingomonas montana]|uniref:CsbD family protein n=1 Tax=Sphingomonas montana TaxID=1843236 RepID=UPI00096C5DE9|nr:CsbD family protein [Sphingomonas montana]
MTRTITALFDARSDAEAAKARLEQSRVDADHIHIHDKTSPGYSEGQSSQAEPGIWASIKNAFLPDQDRHTYEEGVRRGGFLLTVDVNEDAVADVVQVLEDADTVDIDARAETWRSSGWNYEAAAAVTGAGDGRDASPSRTYDANPDDTLSDAPSVYSRRETDRGGSRARSYVSEPYVSTTGDRSQGHGVADTAKGLADEAIGNGKQAVGSAFGNPALERDGIAQERKGEAEQGKPRDTDY